MSLGNNIYQLRSKNQMSQGDLAEALGVSRQSVSKWETDGATPDLDKLLKMTVLFEVSLDTLVKGNVVADTAVILNQDATIQPKNHRQTSLILLCISAFLIVLSALLNNLLVGLLFSVPLLLGSLVCAIFTKHILMYYLWILCVLLDLFMRFCVSAHWTRIFAFISMLLAHGFTKTVTVFSGVSLCVSFIHFLFVLGVLCYGIYHLSRERRTYPGKTMILTLIVLILLCIPFRLLESYVIPFASKAPYYYIYAVCMVIKEGLKLCLTTRLADMAIQLFRKHKGTL